ncbi:MAG: hypothetical protein FWC10_08185 [Lentimicrobiaceae bacterium]|nr:hypothetical protein [Lentimicrobiaceae bacterium]
MNDKILFSEQQKFRHPAIWVMMTALLSVPGIFIWASIQQIGKGQPWGTNPLSDTGLIITTSFVTAIIIVTIILFWVARLETSVTTNEIRVRFFPFTRSFEHYKWEDISNVSIQKIKYFKHGGWGYRSKTGLGLRIGFDGIKLTNYFSKNIIYSVSGKYALQLELKNGKKVMIGTEREKEIETVVAKIERKNKEY